jgi:hypothetical protein
MHHQVSDGKDRMRIKERNKKDQSSPTGRKDHLLERLLYFLQATCKADPIRPLCIIVQLKDGPTPVVASTHLSLPSQGSFRLLSTGAIAL